MSAPRLGREVAGVRAAAPVRHVHLGLGSFFRAHQAWYSDRAPDAEEWGIAAFGGRGRAVADALAAQDGVFTLVTRGRGEPRFDPIASLSAVHPADDHDAWLARLADPAVAVVTMTVTEAGLHLDPGGRLRLDDPSVAADVEVLRRDPTGVVTTAPGRLLAGLVARSRAGAGPLTIVPCDNLPSNGRAVGDALRALAEAVDPSLAEPVGLGGPGGPGTPGGSAGSPAGGPGLSVVGTVVDRITPATTDRDRADVLAATGWDDAVPVPTEPFREWVMAGSFPGGRPSWESAGAMVVDDVEPFERRKLWLLNGGHSLLAYVGSARGYETVDAAVADPTCRRLLESWWAEAAVHLGPGAGSVDDYTAALVERFANPGVQHRLAQIAMDGSQKLVVRVVPTVRAERAERRLPSGAVAVLGAWVAHLRGSGGAAVPVRDARAGELVALAKGSFGDAVPRVLAALGADLADDADLVAAVTEAAAWAGSGAHGDPS